MTAHRSGRMDVRNFVFAGLLCCLAFVPLSNTFAQETTGMASLMRSMGGNGLQGEKLAQAIEKAQSHPLGSRENPVRAEESIGQREYLNRLRCTDGKAPLYNRHGNVGDGVYGYIIDEYMLNCNDGTTAIVYMDMYHVHRETEAIPGFTLEMDTVNS